MKRGNHVRNYKLCTTSRRRKVSLFQTRRRAEKETTQFPEVLDKASIVRYKKARTVFKRKLQSAARETVKSEKLTHKDFAIRINAR